MIRDDLPATAYAFDLHLVCGGYAYFSVISYWVAFKKERQNDQTEPPGRDVRKPDDVNVRAVVGALRNLHISPFYVDNFASYERWLFHRGWALVDVGFAHEGLQEWLRAKPCVKDALGSFTDEHIAANSALGHRTSRMREDVLQRDGGRCLLCNASNDLTMHHVTPFSSGGETTSRNLVTLCDSCNQGLGTAQVTSLYDLAGIPHVFDHGFLREHVTREAIASSLMITKNLMHSRCLLD